MLFLPLSFLVGCKILIFKVFAEKVSFWCVSLGPLNSDCAGEQRTAVDGNIIQIHHSFRYMLNFACFPVSPVAKLGNVFCYYPNFNKVDPWT